MARLCALLGSNQDVEGVVHGAILGNITRNGFGLFNLQVGEHRFEIVRSKKNARILRATNAFLDVADVMTDDEQGATRS